MKILFYSVVIMATLISSASLTYASNWDKLGEKRVSFSLDRDEINVGITQGLHSAIQLKVKGGAINLHQVTVQFDNGSKQDFSVRKNIPGGGETRVLELNGANLRVIRKVILTYDKENHGQNVTVEVWGRHYNNPNPPSSSSSNSWDKLGEKQVSFSLDRDEINVGLVEGLFSSIKLKVNNKPINLHKVTVQFDNGNKQDFDVRKNIPAGGETRVLQLNGANLRVIRKVILLYDKDTRGGTASVSVWGKH